MLREVGEGYPSVIAKNFRNAVRDVTAEFDAEAFYTACGFAPRGVGMERVVGNWLQSEDAK